MRVLVTGGAGFIGSAVVRRLCRESDVKVLVVDSLAYGGSRESLAGCDPSRWQLTVLDIRDGGALTAVVGEFTPEWVVHLAAESHVDRSLEEPGQFIETNVVGTYNVLEAARRCWDGLVPEHRAQCRFIQVSTDEVFGELGPSGRFTPDSAYAPRSPYAASKAGADHLARAWHTSFDLPTMVSHSTNNFGPFQFPEKFIPVLIMNGLLGEDLPIYGDGGQIRDWLYVDDHADALVKILRQGEPGHTYLLGGDSERTNLVVAETVADLLDRLAGPLPGRRRRELIRHVEDRPAHDRRYAIDSSATTTALGWRAETSFGAGMEKTVRWYLANSAWTQSMLDRDGGYRRRGLRIPR